jgi:hypothetical protein
MRFLSEFCAGGSIARSRLVAAAGVLVDLAESVN